jgi:MFS family permease
MTPIAILTFLVSNPWTFLVLYGLVQLVAMPSMMYLAASLQMLSPAGLRGQLAALAAAIYSLVGLGLGPTIVGALTDYVFRDEQKLGISLIILLGVAMPLAFTLLRSTLGSLGRAVELAENH